MEASTTFKKIFSVTTWNACVTSAAAVMVEVISLMVVDPARIKGSDPSVIAAMRPTNPSPLLPPDTSEALKLIVSSFDILTIWSLLLLSIGLAVIAGKKQVTVYKTSGVIFGLWAFWVGLRVVWKL